MATKHAHIVTRVNASQIKKEVINGEEHYRIPSATLPDGVVMNGGYYGAEEIAASYKSLEGTPAPLGHPKVGNQFIPASSPLAINKHWIGAWNENVRREGGRVLLDKVVNIRVANQTEEGRQLIQAIEKQEPIHTSTGLQLEIKVANGESRGKPYTWAAQNMVFDHDCFLLGEQAAATPDEGVGVFVNSQQEQSEVMVFNLDLEGDDEWVIESMADQALRQRYEPEKNSLMDQLRQAFRSVLAGTPTEAPLSTNAQEGDMSLTKEDVVNAIGEALKPYGEKLDAANAKLGDLEAAQKEQGETVTALKANADAAAAAQDAQLDEQLKANGFDDEDLKGMTTNAKQKVLAKQSPAQGFHINASFGGNADKGPQDTLPE